MKRNLEDKISRLLDMFPAVAIIGPRQSGKTTLAKKLKPNWLYIDLERVSDLNRVMLDPEFFLEQNDRNVIIDEAQLLPKLFELLRSTIDEDRDATGRFLITGSSSINLLNNISESLAGRIAVVELGTFKANELFKKPLSDFYNIFENDLSKKNLDNLPKPELTIKNMQDTWYGGGYPEPNLKRSKEFYLQWMESYEDTYINRDISKLYPKLNKIAYQRFLNMLCRLSSTILNKSEIARGLEVSESSIREFLNIADGTFLWRQLPSYEKSVTRSLVKMPKGHIRDSGLLHSLLKITSIEKLYYDPIIGQSFESFVIEEIIKGIHATMLTHWSCYYYRTRSGVEIDLILDGPFGVLPIEIKYGSKVSQKQFRNLEKFVIDNNCKFGLLINQAKEAYWLSRYIFQLPVNYL